jgi:hypothetical protein
MEKQPATRTGADFELDRLLHTSLDTTADGQRRCDRCWKGLDHDGDVATLRCLNAATVWVYIVEHRPPYHRYYALFCSRCAEELQEPPTELDKKLYGEAGELTLTVVGNLSVRSVEEHDRLITQLWETLKKALDSDQDHS